MKKLLILIFTITLIHSCSKNDDDSGDTLPAITQTGANTVGCLVNGEVFLPKAGGLSPEVNCFYQVSDGEFYFAMNFSDRRGTNVETVRFNTQRITLEAEQTYILDKNFDDDGDFTGGRGNYRTSANNQYDTNTIQTGELYISRVDLSNSIVSGTFWFDAINANGEIVQIRDGRFDWNY